MGNVKNPITTDEARCGNNAQTITSLEVAEMVEKEHKELLRDIRRYCEYLNGGGGRLRWLISLWKAITLMQRENKDHALT